MEQSSLAEEEARNQQAWEELRGQIRREYSGKCVAIAHGRLAAVGDDFAQTRAAVLDLQPPPLCYLLFRADEEPSLTTINDDWGPPSDPEFDEQIAQDRQAWESLRDQLRREHPGEIVVIAHGRLLVVTPSAVEAIAAVDALKPAPRHYLLHPVDEEPIDEPIVHLSAGSWLS